MYGITKSLAFCFIRQNLACRCPATVRPLIGVATYLTPAPSNFVIANFYVPKKYSSSAVRPDVDGEVLHVPYCLIVKGPMIGRPSLPSRSSNQHLIQADDLHCALGKCRSLNAPRSVAPAYVIGAARLMIGIIWTTRHAAKVQSESCTAF